MRGQLFSVLYQKVFYSSVINFALFLDEFEPLHLCELYLLFFLAIMWSYRVKFVHDLLLLLINSADMCFAVLRLAQSLR